MFSTFLNALEAFVISIFTLFYWISQKIAIAVIDMLSFIIRGEFLHPDWGYTNNPVIDAGLSMTQGVANIMLVVILIVIVMGIILSLESYGSQKMFVHLIIVALLVNFAPLLVGLIVDAANVVMNHFLVQVEGGIDSIYYSLHSSGGEDLLGQMSRVPQRLSESMAEMIIILVFQTVINIVMAFIILVYALLFLFRHIALWMITILSPIAFVSLIHPLFKDKIWKDWWNHLIEWSLIGAVGAFFLYLSMVVNEAVVTMYRSGIIHTEDSGMLGSFFMTIFPLLLVSAFFTISFITSMKVSAMGADKIVNYAQERRKRMQNRSKQALKWAGGKMSEKTVGRALDTPTARRMANALATSDVPIVGAGVRKAGLSMGNYRDRTTSTIQEKLKGKDAIHHASAYQGAKTDSERFSVVSSASSSGNLPKMMSNLGDIVNRDMPGLIKKAKAAGKEGVLSGVIPTEYLSSIDNTNDPNLTAIERQEANINYSKEASKIASKMVKDKDTMKASANNISSAILTGRGETRKAGNYVLNDVLDKGDVSSVQGIIDNSEEGEQALYAHLERYYDEHAQADGFAIQNPEPQQKRYYALQFINSGLLESMKEKPIWNYIDIKEERI